MFPSTSAAHGQRQIPTMRPAFRRSRPLPTPGELGQVDDFNSAWKLPSPTWPNNIVGNGAPARICSAPSNDFSQTGDRHARVGGNHVAAGAGVLCRHSRRYGAPSTAACGLQDGPAHSNPCPLFSCARDCIVSTCSPPSAAAEPWNSRNSVGNSCSFASAPPRSIARIDFQHTGIRCARSAHPSAPAWITVLIASSVRVNVSNPAADTASGSGIPPQRHLGDDAQRALAEPTNSRVRS